MIYRSFRPIRYIGIRQINRNPKGKMMTSKTNTHVIWDFPVRIFNIGREKLMQYFAERARRADERWLNG